ncbi:nucleic acid-binding, OB-fold protein [Tanacetum coccineum]
MNIQKERSFNRRQKNQTYSSRRSEKFKELVDDMAMQVVACPKVEYVSVEDIPESIVTKEKDIEMQKIDILIKTELRGKLWKGM